MKFSKTVRDVFISVVSVLGVVSFYRKREEKKGPLVRVLVFHDVLNGEWFQNVIQHVSNEYHVLTPEAFMQSEFHPTRINILITFDDGYASWVNVCLPILAKFETKALFFVNSGLVDLYGQESELSTYMRNNLCIGTRESISWDGVRLLRGNGHTIGGHTSTHARLSAKSKEEQEEEIVGDKRCIESSLGEAITTFAYPFGNFGDYTEVTQSILKQSGYTYAFTTEGVFAEKGDTYRISRMCVEDNQSVASLGRWIMGGYDVYRKIKSVCVR